jgi:hypothetical protein
MFACTLSARTQEFHDRMFGFETGYFLCRLQALHNGFAGHFAHFTAIGTDQKLTEMRMIWM